MNVASVYVGSAVQLFGVCGATVADVPRTTVSIFAMSHPKLARSVPVKVFASVSLVMLSILAPVRVAVGVLVIVLIMSSGFLFWIWVLSSIL